MQSLLPHCDLFVLILLSSMKFVSLVVFKVLKLFSLIYFFLSQMVSEMFHNLVSYFAFITSLSAQLLFKCEQLLNFFKWHLTSTLFFSTLSSAQVFSLSTFKSLSSGFFTHPLFFVLWTNSICRRLALPNVIKKKIGCC